MPKHNGPDLKRYMEKRLRIKLNGKRQVSGVLRGYDQFMNLVLDESTEELAGDEKNEIGMVVRRAAACSGVQRCAWAHGRWLPLRGCRCVVPLPRAPAAWLPWQRAASVAPGAAVVRARVGLSAAGNGQWATRLLRAHCGCGLHVHRWSAATVLSRWSAWTGCEATAR